MNILSGCTKSRFESEVNHRAYANLHGYNYLFDSKARELRSPYDHKMYAILDQPIDNEWCFWMDDDAFFMQMEAPLEPFLKGAPLYAQMIFAKSPINPKVVGLIFHQGTFSLSARSLCMTFSQKRSSLT